MTTGLQLGTVDTEGFDTITGLSETDWTEVSFAFQPTVSGVPTFGFNFTVQADVFQFDQVSLRLLPQTPGGNLNRHSLPGDATGVYYATLDGNPVWPAPQETALGGWFYDATENEFYFQSPEREETGTDNLVVYYFTARAPEIILADLLAAAGLYADQAAALEGMTYTATGKTIARPWFATGTAFLVAISEICEFCNYRFWFDARDVPHFVPSPTAKGSRSIDFAFSHSDIEEWQRYEDRGKFANRVMIQGEMLAQPVGMEETEPSYLIATDSDSTSIGLYGELALSIKNHLFQDQAEADAMCAELVAERKDPHCFFQFDTGFCPVPLEIGDTIRWQIRLSPDDGAGRKFSHYWKFNSGVKFSTAGIIVVQYGLVRDIELKGNHTFKYLCEGVSYD